MQVARGLADLPRSSVPAFIAVGVFDGLHLGHAYLLSHLVEEAAGRRARPVVVTFDHHPDEVIAGAAPPILCDPDERLSRLADAGVETTVVVHFDRALRETPYEAFVAAIAERVPVAGFLMTPEAAFGYQRAGTPAALGELGAARGFEVVVAPPFELDGTPVRSSAIRAAIASGDLDGVARLLGRPHAVVGEASPEGERCRVRFPMPVALPPDGWYRATVAANGPAGNAQVLVEGTAVAVPATGVQPGATVRIEFAAAVDPAARGM